MHPYKLRKTTTTPARRLSEGENPERPCSSILGTGTPNNQSHNVPVNEEQSPVVPSSSAQPPQPAIVPQGVEQRGGDRASAAWGDVTNTMKLVLIAEASEYFVDQNPGAASRYLNLTDEENSELELLVKAENEREARYELDVAAYERVLLTISQNFSPGTQLSTQQRQALEEAEQPSKRNLRERAPEGFLVKAEDIETVVEFVRGRVANGHIRQELLAGLVRHRAKDYSRETVGALMGEDDDDEE